MSDTKYCRECTETKPVTAFYRDRSRKDGLQAYCKDCQKGHYENRKANGLCTNGGCAEPVEGKTLCQKHMDEMKTRNTARHARLKANGLCTRGCGEPVVVGKARCQKCLDMWRTSNLLRRYGLTPDQYEAQLEAQGFACKICRKTEPGGKGRWHVDHDHDCCPGEKSCGKCVRGLLCSGCNLGIGLFNDNPAALVAASEYLTSFAVTDEKHRDAPTLI